MAVEVGEVLRPAIVTRDPVGCRAVLRVSKGEGVSIHRTGDKSGPENPRVGAEEVSVDVGDAVPSASWSKPARFGLTPKPAIQFSKGIAGRSGGAFLMLHHGPAERVIGKQVGFDVVVVVEALVSVRAEVAPVAASLDGFHVAREFRVFSGIFIHRQLALGDGEAVFSEAPATEGHGSEDKWRGGSFSGVTAMMIASRLFDGAQQALLVALVIGAMWLFRSLMSQVPSWVVSTPLLQTSFA